MLPLNRLREVLRWRERAVLVHLDGYIIGHEATIHSVTTADALWAQLPRQLLILNGPLIVAPPVAIVTIEALSPWSK